MSVHDVWAEIKNGDIVFKSRNRSIRRLVRCKTITHMGIVHLRNANPTFLKQCRRILNPRLIELVSPTSRGSSVGANRVWVSVYPPVIDKYTQEMQDVGTRYRSDMMPYSNGMTAEFIASWSRHLRLHGISWVKFNAKFKPQAGVQKLIKARLGSV